MSNLNNIRIQSLDDGMVSLHINDQPISSKFETKFEASIVDDLSALADQHAVKLFEQFIFSHTDLNFEHQYKYVTSIVKQAELYQLVKNFVYVIKVENQPDIEHVITKQGQAMTAQDVNQFIQAHVQKSLTDYTDLNYAY